MAEPTGPDLVSFCGLELGHPIINGSGTFDAIAARRAFGDALAHEFPFAAFVTKTITLAAREGNPPPRLWETPAGLINSIGLPNRGLAGYLDHDLPALTWLPVPLITNVMGSTAGEVVELIRALDGHPQIAAFELNVSCPNVRTGLDLGSDPDELERLMQTVRPHTTRPVIVKLTPNTADVAAVAAAAERGGADSVSLINTLRALALHPHRGGPWLGGGSGGLSGPAIRAVALEQVARVADRVAIPVVGMGGVESGADADAFLRVGATLVAVGTASFRDAGAGGRIARELDCLQSSAKSEFEPNRQPRAPHPRPRKHLQNTASASGALNVA
jgi:dihydroorotate dehydrogenase (NAD+) catalytic subunit